MRLRALEVGILRLAVDDYFGLWEIVEEVRAASDSHLSLGLDAAQGATLSMLERGLLGVAIRDGPVGTPVVVDSPLAEVLISDDASWAAPSEGGSQTLVFATPQGESAYYQMRRSE